MDNQQSQGKKDQSHVNGHIVGPLISEELRNATHDFVDQLDAVKRAAVEAVRDGLRTRSQSLVHRMEDRPLQTILMIFGCGYLMGRLAR